MNTTTKTPKLTNAKTLAVLVDVFTNGTAPDDAIVKVDGGIFSKADFDAKAAHILANALKPAAKASSPSKAAIANTNRAHKFAAEFDGDRFTSKDVQAFFGFDKAPAATAVIMNGQRGKLFAKVGYDGSRTIYEIVRD